jgi:hypothetical protein
MAGILILCVAGGTLMFGVAAMVAVLIEDRKSNKR